MGARRVKRARWAAAMVTTAALVCALAPAAPASAATHRVLVVGNNWDGTADIVDPLTFQKLVHMNIVPDKQERLAEIHMDPVATGYFTGVNLLIGEGHDQYVDDAFTSHDGRFLYVSRPSFVDVVAFDMSTKKIVWRAKLDGNRADHMAISPDGHTLLVSASTANKVHAIDTATGKRVGEFESGDSPHENNYSADGTRIFHASIGMVYTPADDPSEDAGKGKRYFQIVDAKTLKIIKRIDMGQKLKEAGYPNMSSAVRPMAIAPGEKIVYLQISFLHGFVEYDLEHDKVLRVAQLPISDEAKKLRRDEYVLDSAHHGIAINPEGKKLCVAGTMSDYAAIVDRATFAPTIAVHAKKPYWATNSADGQYCFVSFSGDDRVSVISYAKEKEVASIPVGDHPQRMRMGTIDCAYLGPDVDCVPPKVSRVKVVRGKSGRRLRVRLSEPARLRITMKKAGKKKVRLLKRSAKAGTNRFKLGKLANGARYKFSVKATDRAGNESPRRFLSFSAH